jgi:hypothetical protein
MHAPGDLVVVRVSLDDDIDDAFAAHGVQLSSLTVVEKIVRVTANWQLRCGLACGDVVNQHPGGLPGANEQPVLGFIQGHGEFA